MVTKTHVAGAILLTGTLFLAGACGYKTDPVPPDSIVPQAIEDLRYSVSEKGVTLTWTFPRETIKGTDLTDIATFDLYRAVVPLQDYCPTCPIPFSEAIQIAGGSVDPEENRQAIYKTALLRSGHKYFFKVSARTSWWAAGPDSNIISFVWHIPAKGPQDITAKAADSSAMISWQPVTKLMDGQDVAYPMLYQVQRSKDNTSFNTIGSSQATTKFKDSGLRNGVTYYYKVQSILVVDGNPVHGGFSESISIIAVDQTPPAPPSGVTVVQTAVGIKIFWNKSQEADVQGYRVYRRSVAEKTSKQIGDVSGIHTIFADSNVSADVRYYYSVTAYDQAEVPNESKQSQEAGVRH